MRVALLAQECSPGYVGGGIGSYTMSLADGLAALGVDTVVVGRHDGLPRSTTTQTGVRVVFAPRVHLGPRWTRRAPMLADRLEAMIEARRALRRLGAFDVVEGPDWLAEGLLAPRGALRARHVHGSNRVLRAHARRPRSRAELLADAVEATDLRLADVVTVASRLSTRLPGGRQLLPDARLVPMPVRLGGWRASPAGRAPRVVTLVGRIEPRKGGDVLVRAAARLPGTVVRLVGRDMPHPGGPSFLATLRQLAQTLAVDLDVVGPVAPDSLAAVLETSRVVVVASRFEPYSVAALEGLAASRPVVVSDACGVAEVLPTDVARFPDGDDEALADRLLPLLDDSDRATAAGAAGREYVVRSHSPDAVARAKLVAWGYADGATG